MIDFSNESEIWINFIYLCMGLISIYVIYAYVINRYLQYQKLKAFKIQFQSIVGEKLRYYRQWQKLEKLSLESQFIDTGIGESWHKYQRCVQAQNLPLQRLDNGLILDKVDENITKDQIKSIGITRRIYAIEPVEEYCNYQTIWKDKSSERIMQIAPGLFLGLGILGTFVGLTSGIGSATAGIADADIDKVRISMQGLLSGASVAFRTSIVGLVLSLFSNGLFRIIRNSLYEDTVSVQRMIQEAIPLITLEQILYLSQRTRFESHRLLENIGNTIKLEMSGLFKEMREADKRNTDNLVNAINAVQTGISTFSKQQSDALGHLMDESLSKMTSQVATRFQNMTSSFDTTAQSIKSSATRMSNVMGVLERSVKTASQNLLVNVQRVTKRIRDTVHKSMTRIQDRSKTLVTEITNEATQAHTAIQNTFERTNNKFTADFVKATKDLQAFTVEQHKLVMEETTKWKDSLHQTQDLISQNLESMKIFQRDLSKHTSMMVRQLTVAQSNLRTSIHTVKDDFSAAMNQTARNWRTRTEKTSINFHQQLLGTLRQSQEKLRATTDQLSDSWKKSGQEAAQNFVGALENAGKNFANECVSPLQNMVKVLEPLVQQMHAQGDQTRTVIDAVSKLTRKLNHLDSSLGQAFFHMETSLRHIEEIVGDARELIAGFKKRISGVSTVQSKVQADINTMNGTYNNLVGHMRKLFNMTHRELNKVSQLLNAQNLAVEKNFGTIDRELSQALDRMSSALRRWIQDQNAATKVQKDALVDLKKVLEEIKTVMSSTND